MTLGPAKYRAMLKRQKAEPCKVHRIDGILAKTGEPWVLDVYWFKSGFYAVNPEFTGDEIPKVIEDYVEQENEKIRAREVRKAKELASVRDRIRGGKK